MAWETAHCTYVIQVMHVQCSNSYPRLPVGLAARACQYTVVGQETPPRV